MQEDRKMQIILNRDLMGDEGSSPNRYGSETDENEDPTDYSTEKQ